MTIENFFRDFLELSFVLKKILSFISSGRKCLISLIKFLTSNTPISPLA